MLRKANATPEEMAQALTVEELIHHLSTVSDKSLPVTLDDFHSSGICVQIVQYTDQCLLVRLEHKDKY